MKIYDTEPKTWKELEIKTAEIFNDINCITEVQKTITTVRGKVNIDVFVKDKTVSPNLIYLCECKYWEREVPQTVIHSFRTIVNDYGAHCGYIIAKNGFQSGTYEAAQYSNVFLFSWEEFLACFTDRWLTMMISKLHMAGKPLRDYCSPVNTFFLANLQKLTMEERYEFEDITRQYINLSTYTFKDWYLDIGSGSFIREDAIKAINYVVNDIIKNKEIKSYRDYFIYMFNMCESITSRIDDLLKEKLRKS